MQMNRISHLEVVLLRMLILSASCRLHIYIFIFLEVLHDYFYLTLRQCCLTWILHYKVLDYFTRCCSAKLGRRDAEEIFILTAVPVVFSHDQTWDMLS